LLHGCNPRSRLRGKKRAALNSLLGYFRSRVGITDYPVYRDHNWQIGSGMIESTAKQLVGIRLKGPGMHWSPSEPPPSPHSELTTSTTTGINSGKT